jgi:large subunit ribosomal protein L25
MNNLKATKRESQSAGFINKLRQKGFIPAILYGGKTPNQKISIEKKSIQNIIRSETFLSKVLEIELDGKKERVLPRDVAYNVISDEPIHIDFMRIVTGSKIIIEIPVIFKNHSKSPGLKRGGVLNIVRRKVELKCPTDKIPDNITVDLDGTDIGTSIKISSVKLSEDVKPTISDRDFVIATVAAPTVIKEPEKPAEGEAVEGAEGTDAAAAEGTDASAAQKTAESSKDEKGKDSGGDKTKKAPEKKPAGDKKTPEKK